MKLEMKVEGKMSLTFETVDDFQQISLVMLVDGRTP
jgi:hypothetical protein